MINKLNDKKDKKMNNINLNNKKEKFSNLKGTNDLKLNKKAEIYNDFNKYGNEIYNEN